MDVQLTDEQAQVRELCREFADKELRPNARRWDAEHVFPREAVRQLGEMGLMGVMVPAEWGGAGMGTIAYALAMEEISRGLRRHGRDHERQQLALLRSGARRPAPTSRSRSFLEPFARGQKLGCFALTEPMSGSDAAEMRTTAVRSGRRLRAERHQELHHQRAPGRRHAACSR